MREEAWLHPSWRDEAVVPGSPQEHITYHHPVTLSNELTRLRALCLIRPLDLPGSVRIRGLSLLRPAGPRPLQPQPQARPVCCSPWHAGGSLCLVYLLLILIRWKLPPRHSQTERARIWYPLRMLFLLGPKTVARNKQLYIWNHIPEAVAQMVKHDECSCCSIRCSTQEDVARIHVYKGIFVWNASPRVCL